MFGLFDNGLDGSRLFRELLRLLPSVRVEDYYDNGVWDRECLLLDLELIENHREKAGAPKPPPLEDIPEVELPEEESLPPWKRKASKPTHAPPLPPPPPSSMHRKGKASNLTPAPPLLPPPSSLIQKAETAGQHEIMDFAKKWRLSLNETEAMLSRLSTSQRRWVIKHYAYDASSVDDTSIHLRWFICENSLTIHHATARNLWSITRTMDSTIQCDYKTIFPLGQDYEIKVKVPSAQEFKACLKVEVPSAQGFKLDKGSKHKVKVPSTQGCKLEHFLF